MMIVSCTPYLVFHCTPAFKILLHIILVVYLSVNPNKNNYSPYI